MKKPIFLIVLFAVLTAALSAQQLTVAVSQFDIKNGADKNTADVVTEVFTANLAAAGRLRIVDRNSFDRIMNEMRFQTTDWADSNKVAQLGRALNANSIIRGNVMLLAGQIIITAYILDINTAQILSTSSVRVNNINEIYNQLPSLSNGIIRNLDNLSNRPYTALGQYTIVMSSFDIRGGLPAGDVDVLTELFITELVANGAKIVDRNSFEKISAEMKFQASDWSDGTKLAQLGRALNANAILRGSVMSLGQTIITSTILDINTAQILSSSTLQMAGINEIFSKLPAFVKGLEENTLTPANVFVVGRRSMSSQGIIFYDKGQYTNGWRYLEAAPVDLPNRAYGQDVPGTSTAIGAGKRNTELIVNRLNQLGETGGAAQMCAQFEYGGYRDWFLPSKDELDLMYRNLKAKGLGGFSNNWYWSSSLYNYTNLGWLQRFSDGSQDSAGKSNAHSVRAVRAF